MLCVYILSLTLIFYNLHIFMNCWFAKAWLLFPLVIRFEGIPVSFIDWLENTISKASMML